MMNNRNKQWQMTDPVPMNNGEERERGDPTKENAAKLRTEAGHKKVKLRARRADDSSWSGGSNSCFRRSVSKRPPKAQEEAKKRR